jgi:hypothetical protein
MISTEVIILFPELQPDFLKFENQLLLKFYSNNKTIIKTYLLRLRSHMFFRKSWIFSNSFSKKILLLTRKPSTWSIAILKSPAILDLYPKGTTSFSSNGKALP